MRLPIITNSEDVILRSKSKKVEIFDGNLKNLVQSMIETMLEPDGNESIKGVGLAANQVGTCQQIIIITFNANTKKDNKIIPMINPEILELSKKEVVMEEGCLSIPGIFYKLSRPSKVLVRWQNIDGNFCEKRLEKWDARIFLHEYDHLNGTLFIDYLTIKQRSKLTI